MFRLASHENAPSWVKQEKKQEEGRKFSFFCHRMNYLKREVEIPIWSSIKIFLISHPLNILLRPLHLNVRILLCLIYLLDNSFSDSDTKHSLFVFIVFASHMAHVTYYIGRSHGGGQHYGAHKISRLRRNESHPLVFIRVWKAINVINWVIIILLH